MKPVTYQPLPREEVIKAVECNSPSRIPLVRAKWWGEGLEEQYGTRLDELKRYPEDVHWLFMGGNPVKPGAMGLSWKWQGGGSHDARVVIDEWSKLDEFISKLPDPSKDPQLEALAASAEEGRARGLYLIFGWWHLFFEQPWTLRGMENLLVDFYTEQDNLRRLEQALCDTYCAYVRYAAKFLKPDGFFSSDDLGHQTGPMMSPEIFREQVFPHYKRLGDTLRECRMHFWLHSCGDNTLLLPHLAESGVTVFHPVQKHTMDEIAVAKAFRGKLCFLAGIDVQHTLQKATTDGVRKEVRFLVDTFDAPRGGMCIAAGNGIVRGTPFENIEAFLDEAIIYGTSHRRQFGR